MTQSGSFATKNAGTNIPVTANDGLNVTGDASGDIYVLIQPTGLAANITPLPITVAATGNNKIYDGTRENALVTLSGVGVISGDAINFTNSSAVYLPARLSASANRSRSAGISASGHRCTGNYSFNNSATTTASITPAPLTVSR